MDENAAPLHVHAASTDPGFIPGITPSKPVATEDADAPVDPASAPEPERDEEQTTADGPDTEPEAADAEDTADAPDEDTEDAEDADAEDAEGGGMKADGPAFEALDHRGSITVDGTGLRFRLDDQECEFDWDELGAVEHATSRFGRRLTVTAHTLQGRAYPAEVQAPDKATLKRWSDELDEVLDAHFEE